MNSKTIIYIGIIFLFFSCGKSPKKSPDQVVNNQIENTKKTEPINYGLSENVPKLIEEVDNMAEAELLEEIDESEEIEPPLINQENLPNGIIENDSTILVVANMEKYYKIFGYEEPSKKSSKLFLFSVFTNDVEGNPFKCKYGSFYETSGIENTGVKLKYVSDSLDFKKLAILKNDSIIDFSFVEKEWLEFDVK